MWQHKHYVALTTFMNLGLPLLLGIWHGDIIGTLLLVGLLRLVVNHHVTFFINSLAHLLGQPPYTESNSARDNGFLAFSPTVRATTTTTTFFRPTTATASAGGSGIRPSG